MIRKKATIALKFKLQKKMLYLNSTKQDINTILSLVKNEAENNFIKILNYLHNEFSYQEYYFELDNTLFIPNIYRKKNNTFYIFSFIPTYKPKLINHIMEQVYNKYPNIKIHIIKLSQYKRIIKWFVNKINIFICKKYSNIMKQSICKYCKQQFHKFKPNEKFCSDECANKYYIEHESKRNYYSGYYMDIHHYVRSGWEHNIAKILQWCQLDYDYEQYKFQLSDGSIYIPDFYVYIDNTFYEVKGEQRETAMQKINLFKQDYPDKKLIIINNKLYYQLIREFKYINLQQHIIMHDNIEQLNNINQYRHNNIQYADWELNYEYYTNRRYNIHNKYLINCNEVANILQLSKTKITKLTNIGRLEYYIINDIIYYDKNYIELFKCTQDIKAEYNTTYINRIKKINNKSIIKQCLYCEQEFSTTLQYQRFCSNLCARRYRRRNEQLERYKKFNKNHNKVTAKIDLDLNVKQQMIIQQQNAVNNRLLKNRINLIYDAANKQLKINNKIIDNINQLVINNEYKKLIEICINYNLDFEFETQYLLLNNNKLLILPLFIKNDQTYYFCTFNEGPAKLQKIQMFQSEYGHRIKYKIITKREYDYIINQYENKNNTSLEESIDLNNIICQYCGKKITKHHLLRKGLVRKYCSKECLLASKKCEIEQECLYCHNKFMIKNIRDKTYKQFCNNECAQKFKKELDQKLVQLPQTAKNIKLKFQENVCKQCGEKIYYISNRKHDFCCENCRLQYNKSRK